MAIIAHIRNISDQINLYIAKSYFTFMRFFIKIIPRRYSPHFSTEQFDKKNYLCDTIVDAIMKKKKLWVVLALSLSICSCASNQITLLSEKDFEGEVDGKKTALYTLHGGALTMQVTSFGARVVSLWAPDRDGNCADIATGYESVERYIHNDGERFLGAAIGPVGNRIAKGSYTLDGERVQLPLNNNGNTLHGGFKGLDMVVWDVKEANDSSILFHIVHPAGEEGWPGNLEVDMRYTLTYDNAFKIEYRATTDMAMPVSLTNHSFFNLRGQSDKSILGHELWISASHTTPVDELLIPSGEVVSLDGSPLDFREMKPIGRDIDMHDDQLSNGGGYDFNYCLDGSGYRKVASLYEPESGRLMDVWTDRCGLQFYSGNFFDGKSKDKYGTPIGWRCSIALETQSWPDAINHPGFPDTVLRPGEVYTHICAYRFSTK